jgi:hypothetical protein
MGEKWPRILPKVATSTSLLGKLVHLVGFITKKTAQSFLLSQHVLHPLRSQHVVAIVCSQKAAVTVQKIRSFAPHFDDRFTILPN